MKNNVARQERATTHIIAAFRRFRNLRFHDARIHAIPCYFTQQITGATADNALRRMRNSLVDVAVKKV